MSSPVEGRGSAGSSTTQTITAVDPTWASPQANTTGHGIEALLEPNTSDLGVATDGSEARIVTSAGQFHFAGNAIEFPQGQQLRGEQLGDGCTDLVTLDHVSGGIPGEGSLLFWSAGEWHILLTGTTGQQLTVQSNGDPAWSTYSLPVATPTVLGGIKVGAGLSAASDGTLSTINNGTVTSVALSAPATFTVAGSPITGAGTLTLTWATQTAGTVLAGPISGSAAAPIFRALVSSDLPVATTSAVGVVKPDNSTIVVSGGVLSAAPSNVWWEPLTNPTVPDLVFDSTGDVIVVPRSL